MDEQRRFERIDAPEGAIALTEGNMGKILDISKGGVALMFLDSSFEEIKEEISFDLFASKREMNATRITGRRIWTKAVSFSPISGVVCGKAGIEFMDLSAEQESQLHNLLEYFNPE